MPPDDGAPPPADDGTPPPEATGAGFPLNDTGNGQRFALYFGADALPVPRVGWFVWDGKRWKKDADEIRVRGKAQKVQHNIIAEIPHLVLEDWQVAEIAKERALRLDQAQLHTIAAEERTPEQEIALEEVTQRLTWIRKLKDRKSSMKSDHRTFAKSSGNKAKIDAMLTEATVELAREVDDLDADPLTVNTETGILRFSVSGGGDAGYSRTADMALEPHAREVNIAGRNAAQLITKMMPVAYDPDARAPTFEAFLERIQPDRDMRAFLQRWFGLSMTGLTGEQKFAFLYGAGANGKSVLVDVMARLFGDYATTAKIESLTGRNRRGGGDATPDLVPLIGARLVRASEPSEGERLQEGLIKELTGGEPILVRSLHADFVEVHPIFKLTISGNHKPDIRGTDDGIWRRVLLVPFEVQIPKGERDERMIDKLMGEGPGILNWLIEGLLDYLERGLQEPQAVLDATLEYRAESDPIGTYLAECCLVSGDSSHFMTARDLIDGFNLWLDQKGEPMWGGRMASKRLKSNAGRYRDPGTGKCYTEGKRRVNGYYGIQFQDMFQREFDEAPRNAQGHPVAATARAGRPGEGPI
ncbi:DNA primase family protein [Roseicyclus sp.]|uniref:DNA primase family protein n=1 Tax=Roseicyclus sp. TaxID=1914329 RepID=UPI003F6B733B